MFAALAIIFIVINLSAAEHTALTKTHQFPHKKFILAEPPFDDETLYYALCSQPPKQCTIVQETNPFVNSTMTKKCEINLEADKIQSIVGFGKDKAIIITQGTKDKSPVLKAITVYMSNCKTTEAELAEIPSNWKDLQLYPKHVEVVVFEDGFEVIVKGLNQICNASYPDLYCSFGFDNQGKKIEGPVEWPKTIYSENMNISSPILPDALGTGYMFVEENSYLTGIQLQRKGGSSFVKLWGPDQFYTSYWKGGYSIANNVNGICIAENSTIACWKNGLSGEVIKTEKSFTFKHQHEITNLQVHNLRNGGLLVLMITCPNRVCSGKDDHYYLIKVDDEIRKVGHIDINIKSTCSEVNGKILAKVFENEKGHSCAARLCKSQNDVAGQFESLVNCYSDDEFSK